MKERLRVILSILLFVPVIGFGQQKDTLAHKLDSLSIKADSLNNGKKNIINPAAYNENTRITFHNYFVLLGSDLKQQVILPFHSKRKDLINLGIFGAIATGVAFADEPLNRAAVSVHNNSKTVAGISNYVTKFGGVYEVGILAGMTTWGHLFKKDKMKTTTLVATHAYITAGAVQILVKFLTGRQRPNYINPETNVNDPIFHGPFFQFKKDANGKKPPSEAYSSFPSGHTTAAFAAATVFAMEYRDKPLIPILSYSAATLIGLSRLTENKHWPTDVLFGAALGYLTGKQVVNNYHRYSKIQSAEARKRQTISLNMQYFYGRMLPGLTWTF